jgi:transcriptional regulator with XRE-family HTH domain
MSPTQDERKLEARAALCGAGLRRLRENLGHGLRDVLECAGIDIGHLSRIERGQGRASILTLKRLAKVLRFSSVDAMLTSAERLAKRGGGR